MPKTNPLFTAAVLALVLIHAVPAAYAAAALAPAESTALTGASNLVAAGSLNARAGQALLPVHRSVAQLAAETREDAGRERAWEHTWRKRWLVSLAPLVASESLDAASSYGLRELNPYLAGPDGRFGRQAAALKFGVVGGFVGAEALLVKTFPRSAKFFTVVNYSAAGITTGLAVHNYRLPGR